MIKRKTMCMQSVIPSAISLFGKLFKKGDSALGHLFQRLRAPSLRSCLTRLAAGLGLLRSGFCRRIPAWSSLGWSLQGSQSPCPPSFCSSPEMDQAQKTGGSDGLGGQGVRGGVLCPCQPPFLQEYPQHAAAHTSHCDPGLWPCLLLTQCFPTI